MSAREIAAVLCLGASVVAQAQARPPSPTGSIRGAVVDRLGRSVPGVTVRVRPLRKTLATMTPQARTDAQGRFKIQGLPWGEYGIFTMKENAGYPDTGLSFYGDNAFPRVTLSAQSPRARLRVRLGPKAAVLTGRVTDAVTGRPVGPNFKLVRSAPPHDWLITSRFPTYRLLLPASTAVNVEVTAPRYRTAHYRGIKLASGVEKRLDIRLEPLKPGIRNKK